MVKYHKAHNQGQDTFEVFFSKRIHIDPCSNKRTFHLKSSSWPMALCYKCSAFIVVVAALMGTVPTIYKHLDRRHYNRRTTAEESVIPNNLNGQIIIVTGASYAVLILLS